MNIHILDSGLLNSYGHHLNYCKGIVDIVNEFGEGISLTVWSHKEFDVSLIENSRVIPHFHISPYQIIRSDQRDLVFKITLSNFLDIFKISSPSDIFFIPNARLLELRVLAEISKIPQFSELKIKVLLRYSYDLSEHYSENKDGFEFAPKQRKNLILSIISELTQRMPHLTFCSDTSSIVQILRSASPRAFQIGFPQRIPFNRLTYSSEYEFAYVGQFSERKGFNKIIAALRLGARIGFFPKCFIQCTKASPPLISELQSDNSLKHVTFSSGSLSLLDYYQKIAESRVIFNLYDPAIYELGSSGVLLEALAIRRNVLTTDYGWSRELLGRDFIEQHSIDFNDTSGLLQKMIVLVNAKSFSTNLEMAWDRASALVNPTAFMKDLEGEFRNEFVC